MKRTHVWALAAVLAAGFVVPATASAQVADRIRQERRRDIERDRRYDDRYDDRYNDRYDRNDRYDQRGKVGKAKGRGGPAFCRNGHGHPVHGPRWCVAKGFGLGGRYGYDDRRYDRRYDDYRYDRVRDVVIIRAPSERGRRYYDDYHRFDRRELNDLLGDRFYTRLSSHSRSLGYDDPLTGEWFDDDDGRVITVFAGNRPIADLIDRDRDGRAEDVRFVRIR
jgi:hypothetical protein